MRGRKIIQYQSNEQPDADAWESILGNRQALLILFLGVQKQSI